MDSSDREARQGENLVDGRGSYPGSKRKRSSNASSQAIAEVSAVLAEIESQDLQPGAFSEVILEVSRFSSALFGA